MNKRQANKIVDKILTGKYSQYTPQQQRKARRACDFPYVYSGNIYPIKDSNPLKGVVTSFDSSGMTIDYSTNPDPVKVNKPDIDVDLPPHGLAAGKTITIPIPQGKWGMSYMPSTKWKS